VKIIATTSLLQISQVAVFDKTGINRALAGIATASSVGFATSGCVSSAAGAIDGILMNKNFMSCSVNTYSGYFISANAVSNHGDWWQVDLGASYDITSIVYYNRADCCSENAIGNIIQGLDVQGNIVNSATMTCNARVQHFEYSTGTISNIYIIYFTVLFSIII
jgi:hypothetical protein